MPIDEVKICEIGPTLIKGLEFWSLLALACGTVTGVGFLMMSGVMVECVGSLLPLVYGIGMICEIIAMIPTAEIASSFPTAGSVATYARRLLKKDYIGFFMATALWLGMIAIDGAELMAFGRYMFYFIPQIHYYWWSIIITIFFLILNYLGVYLTGRTQTGIAFSMWGGLALVPILCLISGEMDTSFWGMVPEIIGMNGWMTAIFFGVYCYVGFVTILPAAEETPHPSIDIPKAMIAGTLITGILYITGSIGIISLRPYTELLYLAPEGPFASTWVKGMEVLWHGKGSIYMNCVAIITSLTTANACVYGGGRMLYGMARERQLPEIFRHVSMKTRVPDVSILITGVAILVTVLTGAITIISGIANFTFFPLWFLIAICAYKNRKIAEEKYERIRDRIPFKVPGGKYWAISSIIMSAILIGITFLCMTEIIIAGISAVCFFGILEIYYYIWKRYNKKKGIDIVGMARKFEGLPSREEEAK